MIIDEVISWRKTIMTGVTKAISDELEGRCRKELKKQGIRGEIGRRLQAIISAKKHDITKVAEIYGINRKTLWSWIKIFEKKGVEGFKVASGRGKKSKLSYEQKMEIKDYIEENGRISSIKDVKLEVKKRYDIDIGRSTAHRLLKELGFSHITPRPIHCKKDPSKTEGFLKKYRGENQRKTKI